jgi:HEAT repeat protein
MACEAARSEPSLRGLANSVLSSVPDLPKAPPEIPKGKDEYESMLYRLVFEDLTHSYPFSISRPFAPRISLMGDEAVPYVIEAAKNKHSFLRHNAVLWLSQSDNAQAQAALRELYQKSPDAVVRNRCLEAFARRRDRSMVDAICKKLGSDPSHRAYIVHVLGRIGDPKAVKHILTGLEVLHKDYDYVCASLTALARIGKVDPGNVKKATTFFETFKVNDPPPNTSASVPDEPGTRQKILQQLLLIARSMALGDGLAFEALRAMIPEKATEPKDQRFAGFPKGIFENFKQPTIYLLIECLSQNNDGRKILRPYILDDKADVTVRAHATAKYAASGAPDMVEFFKTLGTLKTPQPICEIALKTLDTHDKAAALELARAIVEDPSDKLEPGQRYIVSVAARMLTGAKKMSRERLVALIERDLILSERQAPNSDASNFTSQVPVIEQLVIELGELKDPAAFPLLVDILRSDGRGRAEACVAIGKIGGERAVRHLLRVLNDSDGWVRFVAARVLQEISGRELHIDWMSDSSREGMIAQLHDWATQKGLRLYDREEIPSLGVFKRLLR